MHRLATILFSLAMLAGTALAQVSVVPGTPDQVNRALSESPGQWSDAAIDLVVSRGLYVGYPDGSFGWRQEITRAEMAVVIARLISSYDLNNFSPAEQVILRRAVDELSEQLGGLRDLLEAHDQQLDHAAVALERHEGEVEALWLAIAALDTASPLFDAGDLWAAIEEIRDRLANLEGQSSALADLVENQAGGSSDLDPVLSWLGALEAELADNSAQLIDIHSRLAELEETRATLSGLSERLTQLEGATTLPADQHASLATRVAEAELTLKGLGARQEALEGRLDELEKTVADHGARIARLEAKLLPERAPFHVSLAVYGSAPDGGLVGQVTVGHDTITGNLGARISADFGFADVPLSLSGAITYRSTMDNVDGYTGIGLGMSFEDTGNAMFGELLLGVSYRLFRNVGVYVEGRYRPYFDGSGDGLAALGGGVQLRF